MNAERGKQGFQPVVKTESTGVLPQPDFGFAIGSHATWTDPETDEVLQVTVVEQDNESFLLRATNGEEIQALLFEMSPAL